MTETVADFMLRRLRDWNVEHVFGYPGDGINGLLAAWGRAGADAPRFVQARHEELAAFEAVGYAKFSGRVGVCVATSGPGAIHRAWTSHWVCRCPSLPTCCAPLRCSTRAGGWRS